jgi:hypothetical protein
VGGVGIQVILIVGKANYEVDRVLGNHALERFLEVLALYQFFNQVESCKNVKHV